MASESQDLEALLSRVETFLKQQRELYGDFLLSRRDGLAQRTAETSQPMAPKNRFETPAGQDLFGNPTTAAKERALTSPSFLPYPPEPWVQSASLDQLNGMICDCIKCPLGHTRTKFVFGVGNPNAGLVLVGEAPGADEDAQGEPFVGRAGQLLNKILEAINFRREDVYICNILKCRPPNNRDPQPEEVEACEPHLWKQLELIKPKLILCLGRIAAQVLLKTNDSLTALRGKVHDYRGMKLMVTYHPAALLRNPHWKRPTWEDVQQVRKMYDELNSQK